MAGDIDIFSAIVLGAVQGLTEFLPVSSSGHLVLSEHLFGMGHSGDGTGGDGMTALNVLVHLGSLLAIVIVLRRDVLSLVWPRPNWRLWALLLYVSIPAAAIGLGVKLNKNLDAWFELQVLNNPWVAACGLFLTSAVLLWGQRTGKERITLEAMTGASAENASNAGQGMAPAGYINTRREFWRAGLVGIAQALAILPGVSRSGSTVATGLGIGWERFSAVRLSFLMGCVAIGGAGLIKAKDITEIPAGPALAAFVSSLVFSLVGLTLLRLVVKGRKLGWFALYTALAGTTALIWLLLKGGV